MPINRKKLMTKSVEHKHPFASRHRLAAILLTIAPLSSARAYEVWFAPCKAPSSIAKNPEDWEILAEGVTGMNANFAPPSKAERPGGYAWKQAIARLEKANKMAIEPFPYNSFKPENFSPGSDKNRLTAAFNRAKEMGYTIRYVMVYDQPDTVDEEGNSPKREKRKAKFSAKSERKGKKGRNADQEDDEEIEEVEEEEEDEKSEGKRMAGGGTRVGLWQGSDFQLVRDWLDAHGHKDVGLMYNCRSDSKKQNLKHPAIAAGLNEGSVSKWISGRSGRHELLKWVSTEPGVRDKPFVFHLTLHHDFNAEGGGAYGKTRQFIRSIGKDILKSTDWLQGSNVVIMPMSYKDFPETFPFLPELENKSTYGNSFAGLVLSLIEQEPLFTGRDGKIISEEQCDSRARETSRLAR